MRSSLGSLIRSLALLGLTGSTGWTQPKMVSPRVIDEPVWAYPLKAVEAGVREGEARAIVSISEEGALLDFMVVGCTHGAFAEEVAKALPKYRFTPARLRGEPTTVRMPLSFYFKQEGTITSFYAFDQVESQMAKLLRVDQGFVSFVCPPGRLDQPLTPTKTFSPRYPAELRRRHEAGAVTVDFFVDGAGRVRLPAVDAGAHPSFTREAIAALEGWQFEPPRSNGQPVIVRALQTFHFSPPQEDAAGAKKTAASR
jgi:TonB family protein